MGRNKSINCLTCSKRIRSDKMKLHTHVKVQTRKYGMKICSICKKEMIAGNLARHLRIHAKQSHSRVVDAIKSDQIAYREKTEVGRFVEDYIKTEKINPDILRREYRLALQTKIDSPVIDAPLRIWQEKLLSFIRPSEREIVWVVGKKGNEGKSWFQRYLTDLHGSSRVFQINIKKNSDGMLHVLSKKIVSLLELFVFNVSRSFEMEDFPYSLLEDIKDGKAVSTKYESSILEFKIPNTVLVFSNKAPEKGKMSNDRWTVLSIAKECLFKWDDCEPL